MADNKNKRNIDTSFPSDPSRDLVLVDPMFKRFLNQLGISIENVGQPNYLPPEYDFIQQFLNGPKTPENLFLAVKKAGESGLISHSDWIEWTEEFRKNFNIIDTVEPEILEGAEESKVLGKIVTPPNRKETPEITLEAEKVKRGQIQEQEGPEESIRRGKAFYETLGIVNEKERESRGNAEAKVAEEELTADKSNLVVGEVKDSDKDKGTVVIEPGAKDQKQSQGELEKVDAVEPIDVAVEEPVLKQTEGVEDLGVPRQEIEGQTGVEVQLKTEPARSVTQLEKTQLGVDQQTTATPSEEDGGNIPVVLSPGQRLGEEELGKVQKEGGSPQASASQEVEIPTRELQKGASDQEIGNKMDVSEGQEVSLGGQTGEEVNIAGPVELDEEVKESTKYQLPERSVLGNGAKPKKASDLQKGKLGPSVHITKQYSTDETPSAGVGGATTNRPSPSDKSKSPGTGGATADKAGQAKTKVSHGREEVELYVDRQERLLDEVNKDIDKMDEVVEARKAQLKAREEAKDAQKAKHEAITTEKKTKLARKVGKDEVTIPTIEGIEAGRLDEMQIEYRLTQIAKHYKKKGLKGKEIIRKVREAEKAMRKSGLDAVNVEKAEEETLSKVGKAIAMPAPKSSKLTRKSFETELDKIIKSSKDYSDLEIGVDRLVKSAMDSGIPSHYVVKKVNEKYEASSWYKEDQKAEKVERRAYVGINEAISREKAKKARRKAESARASRMTREDIEYNKELARFNKNFERLASDPKLAKSFEKSYKKGIFAERYKKKFGEDAEYELQPEKIEVKVRADVENPNKQIHEDTPDIAEIVEDVIGQVVEVEEVDGKPVVKNPVLDGSIFDPKNAKQRRALEKEINRQIAKDLTKRDVERLLKTFVWPNAGYFNDLSTDEIAQLTADILVDTSFEDMHKSFFKEDKLSPINERQALTHNQIVTEMAKRLGEDSDYRKAIQHRLTAAIAESEGDLGFDEAQKLAEDLTNETITGLQVNMGSILPARRVELAQNPDGSPVVRGDVLVTTNQGVRANEIPDLILEGDDPIGNARRAIERDVRIDGMTKHQIEDQINEYQRKYLEKRLPPNKLKNILSKPIELRDKRKLGGLFQELTASERQQYSNLIANYTGYTESQRLATNYIQNELELLSKNPIRYAFAAPVRLAITQIAPGTIQDKIIGAHLKLTGQTDTNKAYALSRSFSTVLNNAVVTEMKVATGLWSRSWNPNNPKSYYDTRNRIVDFGTKGGHWALNRLTNHLESSVASSIASRAVSGAILDSDLGWKGLGSRLSFGVRKRSLKTLKKKKKKRLSLLMTAAGLLGGIVVEAASETLKSFSAGRRFLSSINGLKTTVGETGAGSYLQDAKLAWKHGIGLADGTKYQGFSYKLGQGLRALSVGRGFVGAGISTLAKGGAIFYISTLLGVPMPVTLGVTGVYSGLNFLRYVANHPTLGMSAGENGTVNMSRFALEHKFWGKVARNFNTTISSSSVRFSRLTKFTKALSRYFPGEGLAVSTWLMALGVPAPVALGIGVGGQLGWMGFQRFLEIGKVETVTRVLGNVMGKLNAAVGLIGGLGALEEMGGIVGGIQSLFRDGISWNTAFRAMGVAGIFIGAGVLLGGWIPGLIAGTAIIVTDQIVRWITGKGLWGNIIVPVAGDIFGFLGNKAAMLAGAAFGLLQGMMKLLTARSISQLVEAAVMTTFGLVMALGVFTTAGVLAPAYFVPSAISYDEGNPYRTSEYFKDFSKELRDITTVQDVPGGRDLLYYDVNFEYTGGPNGDEILYGVRGADVVEGVPSDVVDRSCTMTNNPDFYRETEELTFEDRMGYPDNGAGLIAYKRLQPGEKVSKTVVICLNKKLKDISLGQNGLKNSYIVEGYPSTQDITEWDKNPPLVRGGDSDSRDNQGESVGFRIPVRSPNAVITSPFGRRCLDDIPDCGFHYGLDIGGMPIGEPIYPVMPGEVIETGFQDGGLGNYIKIKHDNGYVSVYGHMYKSSDLKKGEVVVYDTVIGGIGSTGHSTGPHLHLEIRVDGKAQNPCDYIDCSKLK